jgi:predicted small metal-binding protein
MADRQSAWSGIHSDGGGLMGNLRENGGIMRELRCRDAGFDCDTVVHGESDDEIFAQAAPHAEQAHGVQVTPEMKQQLANLIHDA